MGLRLSIKFHSFFTFAHWGMGEYVRQWVTSCDMCSKSMNLSNVLIWFFFAEKNTPFLCCSLLQLLFLFYFDSEKSCSNKCWTNAIRTYVIRTKMDETKPGVFQCSCMLKLLTKLAAKTWLQNVIGSLCDHARSVTGLSSW